MRVPVEEAERMELEAGLEAVRQIRRVEKMRRIQWLAGSVLAIAFCVAACLV